VYVRLSTAWADPAGTVHGAGDLVEIDMVTLAQLEERGVVENSEESNRPDRGAPGRADQPAGWIGPGDEVESSDDADAPDPDSGDEES
jgi:hypothetical protein